MHKLVRQQVAWIWIAALAILFSALAPTVSHAMAADAVPAAATGAADEAMQVCTMEGMKMVVHEHAAGKSDPHHVEHFFEHCPYCALHAAQAPPPAPLAVPFAVALASAGYPPLFYDSVSPLFAWTPSSPRGPPAPV